MRNVSLTFVEFVVVFVLSASGCGRVGFDGLNDPPADASQADGGAGDAAADAAPDAARDGSPDAWVIPDSCGDGVVEAPEECDDGNDNNADLCLDTCQRARCGDGVARLHVEGCDDGNDDDLDGCTSSCVACDLPNAIAFHVQPDTQHCYALVERGPVTWSQANIACRDSGAHLVVFASQAEHDAILAQLALTQPTAIGLSYTRPSWRWITGEPFVFDQWGPGEPSASTQAYVGTDGLWLTQSTSDVTGAYICEVEPSRIAIDPHSGHAYRSFDGSDSWVVAKGQCEQLGAHLATITSVQEQLTIQNTLIPVAGGYHHYLGAYTPLADGVFQWATGEDFSQFDNWASPPSQSDACVTIRAAGTGGQGKWLADTCDGHSGWICEWD